MAQVNITLSEEELVAFLSGNREEAFRQIVQKILNAALRAESDSQLESERYERSDDRTDYRNGTRERELTTRIGSITLDVPRHRNVPFHTMLFENYQRTEQALLVTMAEMVVAAVSTRKVGMVLETICGTSFSKSTVSNACKLLDEEITLFRERRLDEKEFPFIMVDATYFKVRENHRIVSKALFVAVGHTPLGMREVLYFNVYNNETNDAWLDFFEHLKANGLKDPLMLTSDAHKSIRYAASKVYPRTPWQRCQFHFTRNILDATPKKHQEGLKIELRSMFNAETISDARKKKEEIISDYAEVSEKTMQILDSGFEDAMTIHLLPEEMQVHLRTSNTIERMNRELKRRSDVIQIFPNMDSMLRLVGSVLLSEHDKLIAKCKCFYKVSFSKITEESHIKLQMLAVEQCKMLQAA